MTVRVDHRVGLSNGSLFDPWNPVGHPPPPGVIAFASANICRWGGHVVRHVSVGEHVLWVLVAVLADGDDRVATLLADALRTRSPRWASAVRDAASASPGRAVAGLMAWIHDAGEALGLGDVLGPLKARPEMEEYAEAEGRLLRFLCLCWHIPEPPGGGPFVPFERFDGWGAWIEPEKRRAEWEVRMSLRGFGPDGTPSDKWRLWAEVWRADREFRLSERALRPWAPPPPGEAPPWPWLDLVDRHNLEGSDLSGRHWIRTALCRAWNVLRDVAGLPEVPALLPYCGAPRVRP